MSHHGEAITQIEIIEEQEWEALRSTAVYQGDDVEARNVAIREVRRTQQERRKKQAHALHHAMLGWLLPGEHGYKHVKYLDDESRAAFWRDSGYWYTDGL